MLVGSIIVEYMYNYIHNQRMALIWDVELVKNPGFVIFFSIKIKIIA